MKKIMSASANVNDLCLAAKLHDCDRNLARTITNRNNIAWTDEK